MDATTNNGANEMNKLSNAQRKALNELATSGETSARFKTLYVLYRERYIECLEGFKLLPGNLRLTDRGLYETRHVRIQDGWTCTPAIIEEIKAL